MYTLMHLSTPQKQECLHSDVINRQQGPQFLLPHCPTTGRPAVTDKNEQQKTNNNNKKAEKKAVPFIHKWNWAKGKDSPLQLHVGQQRKGRNGLNFACPINCERQKGTIFCTRLSQGEREWINFSLNSHWTKGMDLTWHLAVIGRRKWISVVTSLSLAEENKGQHCTWSSLDDERVGEGRSCHVTVIGWGG